MSARIRSRGGLAGIGLLAGLLHLPAAALEPADPAGWAWPSGTRSEALGGMHWHGYALDARVLRIPLPVDAALAAVATAARVPLRVLVHGGELLLTPAGAAASWVLALRPAGGQTAAVLSTLGERTAHAASAPSWVPPGMQRRLAVSDGDGARQAIHTHPGWSAQALGRLVSTRLRAEGWSREGLGTGALLRWRRGDERLTTVFVDAAGGAGMYTHIEARASGRGGQE